MAELALAALASIGGSGLAAAGGGIWGATAAASSAGLAASAAASSAGVLAILQGVASAVSAVGAIGAGLEGAQQANDLADQTELQIGQERNAAAQRQTQMKRELVRVLGENDVAFAAAGIELGSGIAASSARDAKKRAASELSIDRDDDEMRRAMLRARVVGYRRQAGQRATSGLLSALGTGAGFGIDLMERG